MLPDFSPIEVSIYVPTISTEITPGSGIVGTLGHDGRVLIDYADGRNGDNIKTYEDRLQNAAGRHVQKYPTIARMSLPLASLRLVGTLRHSVALKTWYVSEIIDQEAIRDWIVPEELPRQGGSLETWRRASALAYPQIRSQLPVALARGLSPLHLTLQHIIKTDKLLKNPPSIAEITTACR